MAQAVHRAVQFIEPHELLGVVKLRRRSTEFLRDLDRKLDGGRNVDLMACAGRRARHHRFGRNRHADDRRVGYDRMGSSCESETFSGSGWRVDASSGSTARVTCVGRSALLPYWAVRPNSSMPTPAVLGLTSQGFLRTYQRRAGDRTKGNQRKNVRWKLGKEDFR
jgi:hypothetical protein